MMPSMDVSRFHTLLPIHNGATAATESPCADGEAVPPCCYRVLAAAPDGSLATLNFAEFPFQVVGTFGSMFLPERGQGLPALPPFHLPRGREVERVVVLAT